MKTLTAIIFFAFIACNIALKLLDVNSPEAQAAFLVCAKENNLNIESTAKVDLIPTDLKLLDSNKCFFKCILLKSDIINDKGDINIEQLKTQFALKDDDDMIKHMKDCAASVNETDPCERVVHVIKCAHGKVHTVE